MQFLWQQSSRAPIISDKKVVLWDVTTGQVDYKLGELREESSRPIPSAPFPQSLSLTQTCT
uniref:Uncharacterized protein n=1 Tax=Anguilla anguilla TaxID=7936 RepID=A0A0E9UZF2_ANGAN